MSSFELNKIVGAVLLAVLVLVVIGKVGDNLVSTGDGDGHGKDKAAKEQVVATKPTIQKKKEPLKPVTELMITADVSAGKKVFAKCKACHTVQKDKKSGIGPNLWKVVNRKPGSVTQFKYSKAFQGIADKPWSYENLNAFLAKPKAYVKGTKMSFVGLKKVKDRANVIAFLRSLSDSPPPLK